MQLTENNKSYEQIIIERLENSPKSKRDLNFIKSAFSCRNKIKKILNEPETITPKEWDDLLKESETEIALKKTLACSEHTPYNIIQSLCIPEPDIKIIPQLLCRPLKENELTSCIIVDRREEASLIETSLIKKTSFPNEKIFSQENINLLGQYYNYNDFNGKHLFFLNSQNEIERNINELKRIFDIQNDEESPFYQKLNNETEVFSFVKELLHNPNCSIEQKMDLIDYFGIDILEDTINIPAGLEEVVYELCSLNCFDVDDKSKDIPVNKMQSALKTLFYQNKMSEAMEIDIVNKLKDIDEPNYNKLIFTKTLFENMRTQEAFNFFVEYEPKDGNSIIAFINNSKMPTEFKIDYIKHQRNILYTLEQSSLSHNNTLLIHTIRSEIANIMSNIDINSIKKEDKEFLLEEYKKLLSSPDKFHLSDVFFSRSIHTPLEFLKNDKTLKKFLASEINVALREANIEPEQITNVLKYDENIDDYGDNYITDISYLEGKKIIDVLEKLLESKRDFVTATDNKPNKTKIREIENIIEKVHDSSVNNASISVDIKGIIAWDFFASQSAQTTNLDFNKHYTDNEIESLLLKLPLAPIKAEINHNEQFICKLYHNPIMFNKYIDANEHLHQILIKTLELKKVEIKQKLESLHKPTDIDDDIHK